MTLSATEVTAQALTVEAPGEPDELVTVLVAELVQPPTAPSTTSAIPATAHGNHRRRVGECFDSVIAVHLRKWVPGNEEQRPDDDKRDEERQHQLSLPVMEDTR
jgi:hypothetical protein